jgi:hypothetical protein
MALNLKPEPIVIKRTVLKLMEVCCLHFMRELVRVSLRNASLRFLVGVSSVKTGHCNLAISRKDCLDEKNIKRIWRS